MVDNYFTGKWTGTLADLIRFLQQQCHVQRVEAFTVPGENTPRRLDLCYQFEKTLGIDEGKYAFNPWAAIDIFVWDNGSAEIKSMYAMSVQDWELPPYREGAGLEEMLERWTKLEKISKALADLSPHPDKPATITSSMKPKTLKAHQKAWRIIRSTRQKNTQAYQDIATNDPKTSILDLQAALGNRGIVYSERSIRTIVREGEAGKLE